MWISHDGKLYNLANVVGIYKDDTRSTKPIIVLSSDNERNWWLMFDNASLRDEYYQHIQRLVFNLGSSV